MHSHLSGERGITKFVADVPAQAVTLAGCASDCVNIQRRQLAMRQINAPSCELTSASKVFISCHFSPHMRRALPRGFHE